MVVQKFQAAANKKRIIFLDYDGTLTTDRKLADFVRPSANVLSILNALSQLPNTFVYIISRRSRAHLEKWFAECNVGLSAEHGCFFKHPSSVTLPVPMMTSASTSSIESDVASANGGGIYILFCVV